MRAIQAKQIFKFGFLPVLFYWIFFLILTYPAIVKFSTHFFCDSGDGLQNVWNIWWINRAVTELNVSPWFTSYLHYPHGVSLLGHTLNPFNGFLGIMLLKHLSLIQTHNFIVVFSFVAGGFTTFLLAYHVTRSYLGSIVAGYIFTFSSYHFAHAQGHLQLVSLQWIPLFLLCLIMLITVPSIFKAVAAAMVLVAVLLCDYYYFFYCVLAGICIFLWHITVERKTLFAIRRKVFACLIVFFCSFLFTGGILVIRLVLLNSRDQLVGSHPAQFFSTDLLAPIIPGGHWRFAELTRFYWARLPGNIHESSVYVGFAVIFMLIYAFRNRQKIGAKMLGMWYLLLFTFFLLSLGPGLRVYGQYFNFLMPYNALEVVFPVIRMSGVPVRMMVMVMLSAAVISAASIKHIGTMKTTKRVAMMSIVFSVIFLEYLAKPIPLTRPVVPRYVGELRDLITDKGIVDLTSHSKTSKLYYQTVHEKPMAFGYVARIPTSVVEKNNKIMQTMRRNKASDIYHEYGIGFAIVGEKGEEEIYDISTEQYFQFF